MKKSRHSMVLVVEDEPIVRLVAIQGLEDAGFEVVEAETAEEALEILEGRSDVSVLFTDVTMPGAVDGIRLAELVHRHWPAIRIVVTSARALDRHVPDDGCFLPKPYTQDEMTAAVRRAG